MVSESDAGPLSNSQPWNLSLWRVGGVPHGSRLPVPPTLRHAIHIEPLEAKYGMALDREPPSRAVLNSVYKLERILLELMQASEARTADASRARLRWVPIFVSMLDAEGRPGRAGGSKAAHKRRIAAEVQTALSTLPRWEQQQGGEHVVVVAMDRGRCFQHTFARSCAAADESCEAQSAPLRRDQLGEAIVITHEGSSGDAYPASGPASSRRPPFACFRRGHDVLVPPPLDVGRFSSIRPVDVGPDFFAHRRLLAVWRGDANHTGWGGPHVRQSLLRLSATGPANGLLIGGPVSGAQYFAEMRASKFCLCPLGWASWTARYYEAIQSGCIPVTFHEELKARDEGGPDLRIHMPFDSIIAYSAFTLNVPPNAVMELPTLLAAAAANPGQLRRMQASLLSARAMLDWTDLESGPFRLVMEELARRRTAARRVATRAH